MTNLNEDSVNTKVMTFVVKSIKELTLSLFHIDENVSQSVNNVMQNYTSNLLSFIDEHLKAREKEELLTSVQAAEFLQITKATLMKKVRMRELKHYKTERKIYFLKSDLLDYIKKFIVVPVDEIK